MGRAPCCDKEKVKKGPWSPEEDAKLKEHIQKYGTGGNWIALPQKAGLRRCGKSCRLRWLNYLRPNIKHGEFSDAEDRIIFSLFASIGSRWSIIAAQLPGRTDNDIKNYWNTKLKKKLMGIVPSSYSHNHKRPHQTTTYPSISLLQTSSFTGYEPISVPTNLLNSTTCSSKASATTTFLQAQEGYVHVGPLHQYQDLKERVLKFGGEAQASCSSSDGSCNNQVNHGREIEYDFGVSNGENMCLQSGYFYNGVEENQKLMLLSGDNANCGYAEKTIELYGETTIDYSSLEEIKQLISSSTNSCNNFNFFNC